MNFKINVVDLDKTLIPYDSFRKFVLVHIKKMHFSIVLITFGRITRLISQESFKMKIIKWAEKNCTDEFLNEFAIGLFNDLDNRVLEKVIGETDHETTNVLVSASPDIYVQILIDKLDWKGSGSFINKHGDICHLYGDRKILWVQENFPKDQYVYNMSISDSSSDDELLKLFKKEIKWILH